LHRLLRVPVMMDACMSRCDWTGRPCVRWCRGGVFLAALKRRPPGRAAALGRHLSSSHISLYSFAAICMAPVEASE